MGATSLHVPCASAPMTTARIDAAAAAVDGKLYSLGGFDEDYTKLATTDVYDPVKNTWAAVAPMPTARAQLAAGVVDGELYALGGVSDDGGEEKLLDTAEVYDPATN